MIVTPTLIPGSYTLDVEPRHDARGFFARAFCRNELAQHGLHLDVVQANIAFNRRAGTIRGLHYQRAPSAETKLVRCTRGAVLDVVVDLRPGSPTWRRHVAVELTAANHRSLLIPRGCAHGYQTLEDETELSYWVDAVYDAAAEGGVRYDDPAIKIRWPLPLTEMSDKDRVWPLLERPVEVEGDPRT
ncbi:MAG: dTDP-4-dehydrorhamnose 3,5-epimerase family protein [Acidobacteria bacterium]|nr:dTDP-4-dehydrorhamnose 3,5-epimerase family protein [Acidobacteriota bacterium]